MERKYPLCRAQPATNRRYSISASDPQPFRISAGRASRSSRDAASPRYVVAVGEPALESPLHHSDDAVLQRRRRVVEHHFPGIQTMAALDLLVHPLQFEKLGVDAVDPDQRMLPDRRLDRGIRFRTRILKLPPLVDAALDEDRQHRGTDHPLIEAAHLVEKRPIALRGGEQFDLVEIRAAEPAALHHAQEQLRVRRRPADAAGLLLVDVGGQHLARVLRRTRMTHDPREKLREVAHVHRPLLLEVREQALKRHAPLGKPGPRPVVLAVEDSEQTVLEHPRSLPGVARRGEELAVDALDSAGEVGGGAWTRTTYLRIMRPPL